MKTLKNRKSEKQQEKIRKAIQETERIQLQLLQENKKTLAMITGRKW